MTLILQSQIKPEEKWIKIEFCVGVSTMAVCAQLALVNPFIGSGGWGYGYGSLNPSAQVPFGAMRLGPDTVNMVADLSYRHFSGYNYDDNYIRAFSHTHLVGAGANDLGNVGLMPVRLSDERGLLDAQWKLDDFGFPANLDASQDNNPINDDHSHSHAPLFWWATMNKSLESAAPGRYSTYLIEPGVTVDLIALGSYAALHHYTFEDSGGQQGLVVDACHLAKLEFPSSTGCTNATLTVLDDGASFTAHMHFNGGLSHGKMQVWIHGRISASTSDAKTSHMGGDSAVTGWLGCQHGADNATSGCALLEVDETIQGVGVIFGVAQLNLAGANSVNVAVGLSFINASMASLNLDASMTDPSDTYDDYSKAIDAIWCSALSVIGDDFESLDGDDEMEVLLHTASYRTLTSPTLYSEPGVAGGPYIGLDNVMYSSDQDALNLGGCENNKKIDADDGPSSWVDSWRQSSQTYAYQHFSDMSLWDTFRSVNPWQLFAQKPIAMGILRSMAVMTEQQGAFPHWPIGSTDSGCMYGTHGAALVMDALLVDIDLSSNCGTWLKSAQNIAVAVQAQLLAMATTDTTPNGRDDLQHYLSNGFVSVESTTKSPTYTLAYAFDDYILGAISSKLESLNMSIIDHEEVTAAIARGSNFANVWSKENNFFCPRSNNGTDGNGDLQCLADPAAPLIDKNWYTEGDAYHYAYYAFQDIPGLIDLYDSPEAFDEALLSIFTNSLDHPFGEPVPNKYYWAGNEHDILYPWFFNFGPNCSHTQEWTRKLTHLHYNTSPHGIPGNDDYGALSSWLLWASLGLHPLPGSGIFFVGSPRVSKATVYLTQLLEDGVEGDVSLRVVTYNNSDVNVFVKELYVDGVEVTTPFLERSQIEQGALLEFHMTSDPTDGGIC